MRSFRHFDRRGSPGLPQSTVAALHQDKQGLLWIATLDGLAFFDGTEIQPVSDQPNAPVRGALRAITSRQAGGFYVGGSTAVYVFDGTAWMTIPTTSTSISLAEDSGEVLWRVDPTHKLQTISLAQVLRDPPIWTEPNLPVDVGPTIAVHRAHDNTLWLAGEHAVAQRPNGVWEVFSAEAAPSPITAFLPSSDGSVWIGSQSGRIFHARPGDGAWNEAPVGEWRGGWIRTLEEDRRGRIWAAGNRGPVAFGGLEAGDHWTIWDDFNGLHPEDRMTIFADREGTIWFAANGHGLQQWVGEAWSHRNLWLSEGIPERRALVFGISGTHDGGFLAAVFNRGIWRWNGGEMQQYGAAEGLDQDVRMAIEPEPGVIWVGVRYGIFESRDGGRFRQVAEVPNGFVYDFHRSPAGDWYASTSADGIYRLASTGWQPADDLNQHLSNHNVRDLVWRANGDLWAATLGGIVIFAGDKVAELPSDIPAQMQAGVNVLLEVGDEMWIGDYHGIRVWRDGESRRITTEDGAPGHTVYSLASAEDGSIWAGGSAGVSRFSTEGWKRYDVADGLIEVECNLNGLWQAGDGSMLVGTMASLARFDAGVELLPPPPLELHWRDRPPPDSTGVAHLPAARRAVRLAWTAPWLAPKVIEYRLRIPRIRSTWSPAQSESSRILENLGPGDWEVEISARFQGERNWTAPITTRFHIAPRLWETWMFRGLMGLAAVLLAIGTIRWRTRRLARRARDLEQAVQEQLAQIKVLGGLLPICSGCKMVRDDAGYWQQIDTYIGQHSEAEFSHGLCPECLVEMYGEFLDEDDRAQVEKTPTPQNTTTTAIVQAKKK